MSAIDVDRYVLETLMPDLVGHDRHPSAFVVYLALWHRADGTRDRVVAASLRELAEGTGLSKRAVQGALAALVRRRLVSVERASPTAVPRYAVLRPWARRRSS
jgi:hypothetical protein